MHVLILITVTDTPLTGMKVDVCLGMSFSVAFATAVCVLLHRESVTATHRFCQEWIKSSGKQWRAVSFLIT